MLADGGGDSSRRRRPRQSSAAGPPALLRESFDVCFPVSSSGGCPQGSTNHGASFQSGLFFGQAAWHGLGMTLPADSPARFSIDDSIRMAGLDWQVEKRPLYLAGGKQVEGHSAVIRCDSGDVLGVVGDRYQPATEPRPVQLVRPVPGVAANARSRRAGRSRAASWFGCWPRSTGRMPTSAAATRVRKYLLLTSSHDGSAATSVGFCPIRVVCWNTLSRRPVRPASKLLKVRHTASQRARLGGDPGDDQPGR